MFIDNLDRVAQAKHDGHFDEDEELRRRLIEQHNQAAGFGRARHSASGMQWLAAGAGGLMIGIGVSRGSLPGLVAAGLGGALIYNSLITLDGSRGPVENQSSPARRPDPVMHVGLTDESSWESFPASDSPSANQFTAF